MTLQALIEKAIAEKAVGNPGKGNGSYLGQCVSLIQLYLYAVFGIEYAPRGDAWSFVPPTFKEIPVNSKLQAGDIVRYPKSWAKYGHIGLIGHDGRYYDQNGVKRLGVSSRDKPFSGYTRVYRPTKPFTINNPTPAPAPKPNVTVYGKSYIRHSPVIGAIASFMRRNYPKYTSAKALGNYWGANIEASIKEFQRRTGLQADGNIGPITMAMLRKHGFKG